MWELIIKVVFMDWMCKLGHLDILVAVIGITIMDMLVIVDNLMVMDNLVFVVMVEEGAILI